jgi:macrolide-specific efflux system membrane fusion protein
VVLYTVLLDVDNADNALMADMTTQVFFVANQAKNVLTVPVAALQGSAAANRQPRRSSPPMAKIQSREVRTGISDRLKVHKSSKAWSKAITC